MLKKLIPTYYENIIFLIDFDKVKLKGYTTLFFDLDNTLASPYDYDPSSQVKEFIYSLKEKGFKIYLLSNNHEERVKRYAKAIDVNYFYEVKKPNPNRLKNWIKNDNLDVSKILGFGDQVMTDVLLANRIGYDIVLLNALTKIDEPITFIPRLLDKYFKNKLRKKHLVRKI